MDNISAIEIKLNSSSQWVVYENGKPLSSKVNPEKEAVRIISGIENPGKLIILFGSGNLYLLAMLAQLAYIGSQGEINWPSKLLVVETKDWLVKEVRAHLVNKNWMTEQNALQTLNVFSNNSRIDLKNKYDLESPSVKKIVMQCVGWFSVDSEVSIPNFFPGKEKIKQLRIVQNRVQVNNDLELYNQINEAILRQHEKQSINTATISRFERRWFSNVVRNTNSIINSLGLSDLSGAFIDQPCIIVGAGPSLAFEFENLRKAKNKICIIAVDTALKILLNNGVIPDVVVVVDPQYVNAQYVLDLPVEKLEETMFILEPAVYPSCFRHVGKHTVMFDTIFPYYKFVSRVFGLKGEVDMGGSVATTALDVAVKLGFKKLCYVGMDLSFSTDSYHCPGSMFEEFWYSATNRLSTYEMKTVQLQDFSNMKEVQNKQGGQSFIDAKFAMFISWLEKKMELFHRENECQFFNSSVNGIHLKNSHDVSLKDFIDKNVLMTEQNKNILESGCVTYLSLKNNELGNKIKSMSVEASTQGIKGRQKQLTVFLSELEILRKTIEEKKAQVEIAKATCEQIIRRISFKGTEANVSKLIAELDTLDKSISNSSYEQPFINFVMQKSISKVLNEEPGEKSKIIETENESKNRMLHSSDSNAGIKKYPIPNSLISSKELYRVLIDACMVNLIGFEVSKSIVNRMLKQEGLLS